MIGFSFITPTLTAWDRSKLQLLTLQTNERKICPQACGFVPRLTQWARGMIILFSQWARRLKKKGKKDCAMHAATPSGGHPRQKQQAPSFSGGPGFLSFLFSFFLFLCFLVDVSHMTFPIDEQSFCGLASANELTRLLVQGEQQGV